MENNTMTDMTCDCTGMPFTAALTLPILGDLSVMAQGTGVSAVGAAVTRERVAASRQHSIEGTRPGGAGVPVIATDSSDYPSIKSFADGVVRSASWSHPV
ncbi:hypothetical protein [Luteipulveratus mongoliensis]|uniref:Uncharacterized protein n=1 Tax=Luteipulveratus mongoliensis TaxID=571913 RepID=A0A0K1JLL4_9MICO|nr:hypothetical protein [Luteipulveratus mongoliensis]AKU17607.1 hypothetical protein VV02_20100 [Luteipulveratus mongoliensis]